MIRGLAVLVAGALALSLSAGSAFASTGNHYMIERGVGTISQGAPGCQFTASGCTVYSSGTVSGFPIRGEYESFLQIRWGSATSNGRGGYCAPAQGEAIMGNPTGAIFIEEQGTVCEVGTTGVNVPHTFRGSYSVVGGFGAYANASGNGSVTASDNGQGSTSFLVVGTLSY